MTEERFTELAARSFLGDLEGSEAAELEAEIRRRGAAGESAVRELREVLGALALSVPAVPPSSRLWERVSSQIRGEDPTGTGAVAITPIRRRPIWPWAAAAGVAAALALWLGVANTRLQSENRQLRADLEAAGERLAAADTVRARLAEDLDLLAGPTSSVHALAGTGSLPQARARVFLDPATGRAILFAYELPILPPDTVYELWAIRGGKPRAAGVFRPDSDGQARLEITDASLLEGLDVLAVTVEPAPGTEQPTSQPVLISSS